MTEQKTILDYQVTCGKCGESTFAIYHAPYATYLSCAECFKTVNLERPKK